MEESSNDIYFREQISHSLLSKEEEYRLIRLAQTGNESQKSEAMGLLIKHNQQLVTNIATKRYTGAPGSPELMDLVQSGNIGLITAVEKFDLTRNVRLSTYAYAWIRQAVNRHARDCARSIRVPPHIYEQRSKYVKVRQALAKKSNQPPGIEEVAKEMGVCSNELRVNMKRYVETVSISFDKFVADNGDLMENIFADYDSDPSPAEIVEQSDSQERILEIIESVLTPKEERIVRLRFGMLGDQIDYNSREIGEKFSLTRERIRQILTEIMAKLRKYDAETGALKELFDEH